MCLYSELIINKKYTSTKKNGGVIPSIVDNRTKYVAIGCGQCIECRKQKARDWTIRLMEDIKEYKNGKFITLTFSEDSLKELKNVVESKYGKDFINDENLICTIAVRRMLERYRKKYGKSMRHWLITEKGHTGTKRIHIHGIIYIDKSYEIEIFWKYGWVYVGEYVNNETINYIVKYITKIDLDNKGFNGKILTSAGIGKHYLKTYNAKRNKYNGDKTLDEYRMDNGIKQQLPKYYRNNLYNDDEREKLWIDKLDKNERYVLGTKIENFSNNFEKYVKLVKIARKTNIELGYGQPIERNEKLYNKRVREINKKWNDTQSVPRKRPKGEDADKSTNNNKKKNK